MVSEQVISSSVVHWSLTSYIEKKVTEIICKAYTLAYMMTLTLGKGCPHIRKEGRIPRNGWPNCRRGYKLILGSFCFVLLMNEYDLRIHLI